MNDYLTQCVCNNIPYGKENAIPIYELAPKPEQIILIRSCINELLSDGVLIIPDGNKYYRPTKEDYREVWNYFLSINNPVLFQTMKKAVTEYMTALEKEDSINDKRAHVSQLDEVTP